VGAANCRGSCIALVARKRALVCGKSPVTLEALQPIAKRCGSADVVPTLQFEPVWRSAVIRHLAFTLLVIFNCATVAAQTNATVGRIAGTVSDRTGSVIHGAAIEIRRLDAPLVRSTHTDAEGRYLVEALPMGRYEVVATASGFQSVARQDIIVGAGAELAIDFALEVAAVQMTVEVTAHATGTPLRVDTDPQQPRQPIPAHDGAEYLKTIPGFSVIRKGGTDGDPMFRGMAGSRLGILLDGENIFGGCGNRMDPPTAYVFPEAYDRITVLKGPQTVAHGPGNSAGVVLFERDRTAAPGLHLYASPTVGSFGRNDLVGDVRVEGKSAYLRAAATRTAMDNYQDGDGLEIHSNYERWSANGALGWTPNASTLLEVSTNFSDGKAAYADRAMDGVMFARENAGLRFEMRDLSPVVQRLEANAFYNYVDHVMDNYSLRTFKPSMMMPAPAVSNPDRQTVGSRIAVGLGFSASTTGSVGFDWQANRHTVRSSSNQLTDPYAAKARKQDATFDNFGVFGELTQALGDRQRLIGGARFDRWTGHDDRTMVMLGMSSSVANPTAGVERQENHASGFGRYERELGASTTFFAGAGHTQRAPDYWELISKESPTSASAFNARPEKTTQLDTGVLYRRGGLSGSASLFASDITDFLLIQSNYVKTTPGMPMGGMAGAMTSRTTTVTRNIDASSWGGEASLAWALTSGFNLDGSLAYVRGENDTDALPLAQLPPLEARLGARYAADRWSLGGLARLVGEQDRFALNQGNIVGQDLGPSDSFAVFSLNGSVRLHRVANLTMGVDNLLNTTYAEFISRNGADVAGFVTTTRVNEPGRMLWIKLDLRR
jgi:iron complex outermembrane receptor protein